MKYVIYARKSTEGTERQALSIQAQIRAMREIAERENLNIVKIFKESKSAKDEGREEFNEMMNYIKEKKADAILCWKLDRLARNPMDEGIVKHYLQSEIIKVIKTSTGQHLPDDNVIFTGLEFAMATQYSRDLSKNVKRGNREKLKIGWWPSKAPFGYLNAHGAKPIIQDAERAPLLKYAFERYAEGNVSLKELNDELYDMGLRTLSGKKLSKSSLQHKLQNPFYYGDMVRNGETFKGKHKPIITKDLFELVESVRNGANKKRGYKHFYPYRGFLKCDHCGCNLTADRKKGHTYYYCTNGKGICDAHKKYLRSEEIDKQIAKKLGTLRFNRDVIDLMHDAKLKRVGDKKKMEKQTKELLKNHLQRCLKAQDKLMKDHDAGIMPDIIYNRRINELAKEQENLESQIAKEVSHDPSAFERVKSEFLYAHRAKKRFSNGTDLEKRALLENVLSNITFDGQNISQIQYKKGFQLISETPKNAKMDVLLGQ